MGFTLINSPPVKECLLHKKVIYDEPCNEMVSVQHCYTGDLGSIPVQAGAVLRVRVELLGSVSVNNRLT